MCETSRGICRICLTANTNMFNLFTSAEPKEVTLVHMLTSCASVEVNSRDSLPSLICAPCIKTLTVSYNFRKQCERSDKLLRGGVHNNSSTESPEVEEEEVVEEDLEEAPDETAEAEWIDGDLSKDASVNRIKEEPFTCSLCDKSFMKQGNLKLHLETHTDKNICKHCKLKCESYKDLINHSRQQHRLFKCQMCDKSFSTGNALNGHMRYHKKQIKREDNVEYICVINETDAHGKFEALKSDLKEEEITAQVIEGECFTCEICEYRFVSSEELKTHIGVHESSHECANCGLKFSKYDSLMSHNKTTHAIFNCKICTKSFPTQYGLSGHMRHHVTVSKGSPSIFYKCTINNCTRKFTSLDYLRRHKPSHFNKKKVYLCNLCGKTYTSNNSFYYHQKIHRNERPYMCTYCGNAYKLMCHLKSHMWNHTGVRPFECKKCGKRFTRSRVLKKHVDSNCGSKKRKKFLCPPDEDKDAANENETGEVPEVYENVIISNEIYVEAVDYYKDE